MKTPRRALRIAVLAYVILWGCSAFVVYSGKLIQAIDSRRKDSAKHPTILGRSISFAPALFWVDWQQGDQGFDCAGYQGVFLATPFGTRLLWKRMAWIS